MIYFRMVVIWDLEVVNAFSFVNGVVREYVLHQTTVDQNTVLLDKEIPRRLYNLYNNNQELDTVIEEVRKELRSILMRRRSLIQKLGYAFEKVVTNPESICEEIKTSLRDEIVNKTISSRDIERYCLDKWKKKTKPQKNDNLSFSDILEQENQKKVVIGAEGTSLQEPSTDNHSANIGNEKDSLFQSNSEEEDNHHNLNQLSEDMAKSELIIEQYINNGLCDVEFSLPFNDVQTYASSVFKQNSGIGRLWFNCTIDKKSGNIVGAGVGRLNERLKLHFRGASRDD